MELNKTVIIRRTEFVNPLTRGIEFIMMENETTVMLLPPDCEIVFAGENTNVEFEAKHKEGEWITCSRENNLTLTGRYYCRGCSVCGYERDDDDERKDTPYCPQCGAEMR